MEISVIIPTHQRPELLRSALNSVAAQSRRDLVREVIVSENSSDEASKHVCRELSDLPIRHVNRRPALDVLKHFETLVTETSAPWVAWVADDDMWGRYHLAEAERLLALHPAAVAFAGAGVAVRDETWEQSFGHGFTLRDPIDPQCHLADHSLWDLKRVLAENLLRTPLNLWGIVGRKQELLESTAAWAASHASACNDRIFWCKLAQFGPLVVGHEITLFVRHHIQTISSRLAKNQIEQENGSAITTRAILRMAEASGVKLGQELQERLERLPPKARGQYFEYCLPGALRAIREEGVHIHRRFLQEQTKIHSLKTYARLTCPPFLWTLLSRLRRWRAI